MKLKKNQSGFTLLEIIIVIIIIGILASIALPKFFKTVEYSRSSEALANLGTIRRSMDICYQSERTYAGCNDWNKLFLTDPGSQTGALFSYSFPSLTATAFTILATRTTVQGGTSADTISIDQNGAKVGTGAFVNIQ